MEDWPIVVELLESYDNNVKKVESLAQREIFSIEVPVFNGLRDILPFSLLTALVSHAIFFYLPLRITFNSLILL